MPWLKEKGRSRDKSESKDRKDAIIDIDVENFGIEIPEIDMKFGRDIKNEPDDIGEITEKSVYIKKIEPDAIKEKSQTNIRKS